MMKTIKSLSVIALFSFVLAGSLAFAESGAEVKAAIDQTIAKLEEASAAFDKAADPKVLVDLVMEAKQLQKTISTSDAKISIVKARGTNKLGQARTSLNDGDLKTGGELIKEALAAYKEVKEKYDATH
jgi:hypothetical protein